MTERDEELLEAAAATMQNALSYIRQREDCLYSDCPADDPDRPKPCDCAPCVASQALLQIRNWRRDCLRIERLDYNPRERKIVDAFLAGVDDKLLSMILDEEEKSNAPSIRDWYITVSVVRWLATNCGTDVLHNAGWRYTQYEEDREAREVSR